MYAASIGEKVVWNSWTWFSCRMLCPYVNIIIKRTITHSVVHRTNHPGNLFISRYHFDLAGTVTKFRKPHTKINERNLVASLRDRELLTDKYILFPLRNARVIHDGCFLVIGWKQLLLFRYHQYLIHYPEVVCTGLITEVVFKGFRQLDEKQRNKLT